ncbi:Hypothetical predicted protein [Cloeon dipterum]|uniref:PDZ domain-containing protein n=2 Tax=Cloeon dipterum TaxID=197152 RepID=A0A8S1C5S6_9INSE|nr:Hypothetical predicted protein [Cloeon dipterum]
MTRDTANAAPVAAPRTKKIRNAAPAPPAAPVLHSPSELFTAEIPPPPYLRREKKGKKAPKPPVPEKPVGLAAKISFEETETKPEGLEKSLYPEIPQEHADRENNFAVESAPVFAEVPDKLTAVAVDELHADYETNVVLEPTADKGWEQHQDVSSNLESSSPEESIEDEVVNSEKENLEQEKCQPPKIIDEIFKSSLTEITEEPLGEKIIEITPEKLPGPSGNMDLDLPQYAFLSNPAPPIPAPLEPVPHINPMEPKSIFKFYTPSKFNPQSFNSSGAFKVKPIDFGPLKVRESTSPSLEEMPKNLENTTSDLSDWKAKPESDLNNENQLLSAEANESSECKNLLRFDSVDEENVGFDDAVCEKSTEKDLLSELPPEVNVLQMPLQISVEISPNEDVFEGHGNGTSAFSVAAISPRESLQGVESIHQNFNNFTKHMLANDYVLIERTGKNEQSKAADSSPWAIGESAICDTIPEESPSFDVDWGTFGENECELKQEEQPAEVSNETPWSLLDHMTADDGEIAPSENDEDEIVEALEASAISLEEEDEKNCDDVMESELDQNIICDQVEEENERLYISDDEAATADLAAAAGTQEVPAVESNERDVNLEKSWGVLGLRLEMACLGDDENFAVVVAEVMSGGAAEYEGTIQPGDQILAVNGSPAGTLEETVRLFRVGPDVVNLRILRNAAPAVEMGSNVSCEKGLNRRSISSGNLDAPLPRASKVAHLANHNGSQTLNKHCGSLPNYLDRENDQENNNRVNNQLNMELKFHSVLPRDNGAPERLPPLLLPPPPLFHDPVNDQGYGSERSPEEEKPPLLLPKYPFINKENVFEVCLSRGSRGLGLSVTGGVDCANEPWPGLIRIKRLFPRQPAWQDGNLAPGDVLLEVNGVHLTGMTNYEALEVLRTTSPEVKLKVCRPPAGAGLLPVDPEDSEMKPVEDVLKPSIPLRHGDQASDDSNDEGEEKDAKDTGPESGEFTIEIRKVDKSLGFTLWKEDTSRLGHYVRALVKEPAVSDGRIRPGDKIMAVNDVEFSELSHEEAVAFLRKCGDVVTIKLYRDAAQTPLSFLSPTDGFRTFPRTRPLLRKEAMDMLHDLAGKKQGSPQDSNRHRRASDGHNHKSPHSSSPRKKLVQTPPSHLKAEKVDKPADVTDASGRAALQLSLQALADAKNSAERSESQSRSSSRPVSLDLSTPSSARKQKFQFMSPPFSGEDDEDDSSVIAGLSPPNEYPGPSSLVSQPASMPPMESSSAALFGKLQFQSAHLPSNQSPSLSACSDQEMCQNPHGLLKWKGVQLNPMSKTTTPVTPKLRLPPTDLQNVDGEVLIVELTRGWNSRLGFTLTAGEDGKTVIKQIYPDSVAFKDGRLKVGDHIVMVNDENMDLLSTPEVIDLVRKIRGTVAITIARKKEF